MEQQFLKKRTTLYSEPVFVNLLRSPGIDSGLADRQETLFVVLARQATQAVGIDSSESIPGLPKRTNTGSVVGIGFTLHHPASHEEKEQSWNF